MFCTRGRWFKVQNTGYFNGAPYYIPGIKILELSWPFCWYWKEITNRPLRLKYIVSAVRHAQVIINNNNLRELVN